MRHIDQAFLQWQADPSAADDLLQKLRPIVRGWAANYLTGASKDYTEDVTQNALTSIWQYLPRIQGNILCLAKVATRNACRSFVAHLGAKGRNAMQADDDCYEPAPEAHHREYSMPELTPIEQQVCGHIAMGFHYSEIAEQLGLKLHNVQDIFSDVKRKCGIDVPPNRRNWNKSRTKQGAAKCT